MGKCKSKFNNTCIELISSDCVDYNSDIYRENTTLDKDDCNTVTDVLEDLTLGLEEVEKQLDFSGFGCCIDYEAEDSEKGLTIKDIVSTHEGLLCEYDARLEKLEKGESNGDCGCKKDDCNDDDCCNILKKHDSYSTALTISNTNWVKSTNSSLEYKATKGGVYEIILEFVEDIETESYNEAGLGISLNGFDPNNNLFEQVKISPRHTKTVVFVVNMKLNDVARVAYKKLNDNYKLEYIKMIVKKVK